MNALILDRKGGVLWLRLNRPHARNGIDTGMRDELSAALAAADRAEGMAALMEGRRPTFTGR